MARLTGSFHGSPTESTRIPFDEVILDVNNDYDDVTGIYTAPVDGLYHFSHNNLANADCGGNHINIALEVNGVFITKSPGEAYSSASSSTTVQLAANDQVWVSTGTWLCEWLFIGNYYNTFSGYLIERV